MRLKAAVLCLIALALPVVATEEAGKIQIHATEVAQGQPLLISLLPQAPAIQATGTFLDQELTLTPLDEHLIALVAVERNQKPGAYPLSLNVQFADGSTGTVSSTVQIHKTAFQTSSLKVDPKFVELSKEALEQIRRDNAAAGRAYSSSGPERLWHEPFIKPAEARWSSPFGVRRLFNGEERSYHSGADIAVAAGSEVHAANDGRVALVMDMFFGGKTILLDHGQRVFTGYMHLSKSAVEEGDLVKRGQVIGHSGSTGRVTGPHLHWMLRINDIKCDAAGLLAIPLP